MRATSILNSYFSGQQSYVPRAQRLSSFEFGPVINIPVEMQ